MLLMIKKEIFLREQNWSPEIEFIFDKLYYFQESEGFVQLRTNFREKDSCS